MDEPRGRERRRGIDELARKIDDNTALTREIHRALFVGDPDRPSLFTRVEILERDQGEKGIGRAMVAIGTLIGSAIGAVVAIYAFITGGTHK